MIINHIRAEWFKLARRPLSWVLLAVFLILLALQVLMQFAMVMLMPDRTGALGAQFEEWRRGILFPGIFGTTLSHVNGLGGFFAVIFTAGAFGSEYSWGTIRTHLSRDPVRERFLLAKLATILLMLAAAVLIALVLGALLTLLLTPFLETAGALSLESLLTLPLAFLRALYVLLPYVLLTMYVTVLGRSLLVGLAAGLFYMIAEASFGALTLFQVIGGVWGMIYNLTIGQNINTLTIMNRHAFGLHPELTAPLNLTNLPSPLHATLVIAVYSALFLALSLYIIRRRDITGPR